MKTHLELDTRISIDMDIEDAFLIASILKKYNDDLFSEYHFNRQSNHAEYELTAKIKEKVLLISELIDHRLEERAPGAFQSDSLEGKSTQSKKSLFKWFFSKKK